MARTLLVFALVASLSTLAQAANDTYESQNQGPPMLGIEMSPTTLSTQAAHGLAMDQGVQVRQVFPNTAAASMGVQPGDVILSVNGAPIGSMTDLRSEVGFNNVGDPVDVVISRGGQRIPMRGSFEKWPANIPREPLDPAVEQRFKDWQRRHLERNQRDVAQLRDQLQSLKNELAKPQDGADGADVAAAPRPDRAMDEAAAFLKALPAWKLEFGFDLDAASIPAAAGEPVVAQAEPATGEPWRIDLRLGTGQR